MLKELPISIPVSCVACQHNQRNIIIIMKNLIARDRKRRALVEKYAGRRKELKTLLSQRNLPQEERQALQKKLNALPRDSVKCRVTNRCLLTGRSRGVSKTFRISRIKFRELASNGAIPGVKKASW